MVEGGDGAHWAAAHRAGAALRGADGDERDARADKLPGMVTGADQEGNYMPATRIDAYRPGGFYGDLRAHHRAVPPQIYDPAMLWLPREADPPQITKVDSGTDPNAINRSV
jgi:hypothetical protein